MLDLHEFMERLKKRPRLRMTLAILLLIIGVAGLVLPVIPGILFIVAGLVGLGVIEAEQLRRLLRRKSKR